VSPGPKLPRQSDGEMTWKSGSEKEERLSRPKAQGRSQIGGPMPRHRKTGHCLSGNASPLAANAFMWIRAIEQYCVRAAGTSHEVNRELSWMLPRCGRFRVKRDTRVALCHPSPNLGRNLFPPRRFSYHTRFSRFNGTARQPALLGS
jgi:hypothetical protein